MLQCRVLIITTVVPIISKWFCGLLSYFFHFFLFFFFLYVLCAFCLAELEEHGGFKP